MARINTNVPSLIARSTLARTQQELELRLNRLSTGIRLNRGADDPAGLITSERIRSDLRGVEQGINNADRASSVIATAEAALSEVSDLLNSIRALIVESANTGANSEEERKANQLQIDSAIDSITRISNTATFGGLKLLNGTLDYSLSGVSSTAISKAQVFGASFIGNNEVKIDVEVLASAQTGALFLRGDYDPPNNVYNGTLLSSTTLQIKGAKGVTEISLTSGASLNAIVNGVNNQTAITGVKATLINPADVTSGLVFMSAEYGSSSFVSVKRIGGPTNEDNYFKTYKFAQSAQLPAYPPFPWATLISGGDLSKSDSDKGRDVSALVNGTVASGTGLSLSVSSPQLNLKLLLHEAFATDPTLDPTSFFVTGGGALFQLGPEVNAQQQSNIGVQSMAASNLGGTLVGSGELQFLNSLKEGAVNSIHESVQRNDFTAAQDILSSAIQEVAVLRGRLGAFERNILQTNVRSLQAAFENLSASQSRIRDADFAAETSALTRAQILASAGTSVLALANQQSQQVLQLLG